MPVSATATAAEGLAWWETVGLYVGIPLLVVGVIFLIGYLPGRRRSTGDSSFPLLGQPSGLRRAPDSASETAPEPGS